MLEKILIVDDEANVLEALKRELSAKYQVTTAISGMQGLQKNDSEGPFTVVITDYRMPKMNGVQFLVELSKVSPDSVRMSDRSSVF
jgi:DNA-binding NtrC family response regulator